MVLKNINWKLWLERAIDFVWRMVLVGLGIGICWLVMLVFFFSSYRIPSDSMSPVLMPGDRIWVDKTCWGARLFNLNAAAGHKPFKMFRMWGWNKIKVGDVAVFNYPYPQTRDSIGFDLMTYYVKRCMGTPGDTVEIVEGYYRINGDTSLKLPETLIQAHDSLHYVFTQGEKKIEGVSIKAFPKKKEIGWTIVNFGPVYVPQKGDVVELNEKHFLLYRKLLEWEQGKKLVWQDGRACMDGKFLYFYQFQHDYYFMCGDNVFNSVDARYWGLLPDDFIAGKVVGIWKSIDPYTEQMRWNRIGFIE